MLSPEQSLQALVPRPGFKVERMAAEPLVIGEETLSRWEVSALAARVPVTIVLDHLPASRPWIPLAGAGGLAVVLGAGLTARLLRRARSREETSAV